MIQRLQKKASQQKVPSSLHPETSENETAPDGRLLSGRAAAIIGASFLIAICAGALTYLAVGKPGADIAGAILAGGAAFAGSIRLLDSTIT